VVKTGNFVYRLAGEVTMQTVLACQDTLCTNFPGMAWLIPTKGWTWIQLRGVDISYVEDKIEYHCDDKDLLTTFSANPCFQGADIYMPPT
jgi:hypothetical protein